MLTRPKLMEPFQIVRIGANRILVSPPLSFPYDAIRDDRIPVGVSDSVSGIPYPDVETIPGGPSTHLPDAPISASNGAIRALIGSAPNELIASTMRRLP